MLKIELFIVLIIYGLLQGQARLSIHQLEMEIYNTQNVIWLQKVEVKHFLK